MQRSPVTRSEPDEQGHWGKYGGRYVPEILVAPLEELTTEFARAREDAEFWTELEAWRRDYCGRAASVSVDGARVPERDRARSARTDSGRDGRTAARAGCMCWRRLECHRA